MKRESKKLSKWDAEPGVGRRYPLVVCVVTLFLPIILSSTLRIHIVVYGIIKR